MCYLITYLISFITLVVLDFLWLGIIMKKTISGLLGPLLREQFLVWPAVAFYLLYVVAIMVFAIYPSVKAGSWQMAMGYGALLGFTAYMTYDLTNRATLKNWSVQFVFVDIAWGTLVTMLVALVGYWVMRMM